MKRWKFNPRKIGGNKRNMPRCKTGKIMYQNEDDAKGEALMLETSPNFQIKTGKSMVAAYYCEECGRWHVGSS